MSRAETATPLDKTLNVPEAGLMHYATIDHTQPDCAKLSKVSEGQFFCTRIGNDDFVSWVIPADPAQHKPITYIFLKYRVNDRQLVIWDQDAEATAQAIETGKIRGVVMRKKGPNGENAGGFDELRITDSTENIVAFLAGGGSATCFPDKPDAKTTYQRVR